eukprot:319576_1
MSEQNQSVIDSILEKGDIIIMKDPNETVPPHSGIACKTHENIKGNECNNIGVLITGLKSTPAAMHLSRHKWVADVFRYTPPDKDMDDEKERKEVMKIRHLIAEQALKWYNIGQNVYHTILLVLFVIIFVSILVCTFDYGQMGVTVVTVVTLLCTCVPIAWNIREKKK